MEYVPTPERRETVMSLPTSSPAAAQPEEAPVYVALRLRDGSQLWVPVRETWAPVD